jgi:hypothetical protein
MRTVFISQHVQEALEQVRQLQQVIVDRLRFTGFSGPTRAISGTLALMAAAVMASSFYPKTSEAHLVGWFSVLAIALALNGGALIYWFVTHEEANRDVRRLGPVLDILPPLAVGALLTVALVLHSQHDYLFGIWMCMFGLTNLASRHVLPRAICLVGIFYILCGAAWLLTPNASFFNPWIMGLVFCVGEWTGGMILHLDGRRLESGRTSLESETTNES